jgi:hypothetical protein
VASSPINSISIESRSYLESLTCVTATVDARAGTAETDLVGIDGFSPTATHDIG